MTARGHNQCSLYSREKVAFWEIETTLSLFALQKNIPYCTDCTSLYFTVLYSTGCTVNVRIGS